MDQTQDYTLEQHVRDKSKQCKYFTFFFPHREVRSGYGYS